MLSKVAVLTFITSVAAQQPLFQILAPGPDIWWVANSQNNIAWTPCQVTGITGLNFLVENTNQTVLSGNLTILGNQEVVDCSHIYQAPNTLPIAKGYTMHLTDAIDSTKVLASTTFEIRDVNSGGYPSTTAEPVTLGVSSTASAGSGTSSASAAAQTNKNQSGSNGAVKNGVGAALGLVSAAVLAGLF